MPHEHKKGATYRILEGLKNNYATAFSTNVAVRALVEHFATSVDGEHASVGKAHTAFGA